MGDKKHIDSLFQENLKDFEVYPDPKVWKNIEQQLVKKKKRRVIPLWFRLGAAAATLLLLISSGFWFYNSDKPLQKLPDTNSIITDIDSDKKTNQNKDTQGQETLEQSKTESNKDIDAILKPPTKGTITVNNNNTTQIAIATEKQNNSTQSIKEDITVIEGSNKATILADIKNRVVEITQSEKLDWSTESIVATNEKQKTDDLEKGKQDINEALKEKENTVVQEEIEDINTNKWSVGSTVAPIYFNSLTKGSPIDAALTENSKNTNASISYGLKVNYKINDKFSLQSGVNSVELAYTTKNVSALISSNAALTNSTNLNTNVDGFMVVTMSNDNIASQGLELLRERNRNTTLNLTGDLNQSMSYIEIPMEARYSLVQQKFGVNVVGGLSTYILYKNGVTILNANGSTDLGEASNINNVNFSGNLGLDFDYKINKKLFLNVSPMFKYQLNTFSRNDGGFKPYYLGVYTGLNFRF